MKLSSAIIINRLSGQFIYDIFGKVEDTLSLSRPVFLTHSESHASNGRIYIGKFRKNEEIPKTKTHSMFITRGRIPEDVRDKFDCILIFADDTDLFEVVNYINSLYDLYDSWERDIAALARSGCTLTDLLDRSCPVFSNPIMIHDRNFNFITWSSFINSSPKQQFLIDQFHSTVSILNDFTIDKEFRDSFQEKTAQFFAHPYLSGVRTIFKNIYSHDVLLCRVLVAETVRTLQDSDLELLEILSEYISYVYQDENNKNNEQSDTLSHVLLELLKGNSIEDYKVQKILNSYGWTKDCSYICFKFLIYHVDKQNHTGYGTAKLLEQKIPGGCAVIFDNDIVLFINLSLNKQPWRDILDSCKPIIRDHFMKTGVSNPYTGSYSILAMLHRQSCIALETGLRNAPYKWIHLFEEVNISYLLERCISELPATMVCSPEILAIYRYDNRHHTEYYLTLKTYFENNLQPVATSRALFIHRTTFLYRLEKMTEMFNLKFDSPRQRMFYQLSIALLDQGNFFET